MPLQSEYLKDLILSTREDSLSAISNTLQYNLQNENGEKIIISTINQLLNNGKTRAKGLQLINTLLDHCPLSVLSENAISWINYCIGNKEDRLKEIKFETITKIIQVAQNVENFNKKLISDHLLDILKMCLNPTNLETGAVLNCLGQCMQRYSTWFGNHKQKVEPFLLKLLDESNENITKQTALCLFYYQQTGGAGIECINYTNNFLTQTNKLCATIHTLFDVLFESMNEIEEYEKINCETIKFNPPPVDFNSGQILELTTQRIINCLICVNTMLMKKYPAPKQIIPKYLVDVINRGLTPHVCLNQQDLSIETNILGFCLDKIQIQLLKMFRGLTIGYLSSLLPFSHALTKLLVNVLKRAETCDCYSHNLLCRRICHQTVSDWISFTNCNEKHLKTLLPILMKSCFPAKQTVVLSVTKKHKTNKGRDKTSNNNNIVNVDKKLSKYEELIQENNCLNSLKTLENCIKVVIDHQILQGILRFVVKVLFDIKTNRSSPPYNQSIACQIRLYRILVEILKINNPKLSISLHLIIELFNFNLNNSNHQLSQICNDGLSLIEKISHPVCPSLEIPEFINNHDESNETTTTNDKKIQILSDIVIQTKNDLIEVDENGTADSSMDGDEICEILSDDDLTKNVESIDVDVIVENGEDNSKPEEPSLKKKIVEIVDNDDEKTESPPIKKKKEEDSVELDEMFNSFQDIPQD